MLEHITIIYIKQINFVSMDGKYSCETRSYSLTLFRPVLFEGVLARRRDGEGGRGGGRGEGGVQKVPVAYKSKTIHDIAMIFVG